MRVHLGKAYLGQKSRSLGGGSGNLDVDGGGASAATAASAAVGPHDCPAISGR